MHKAQRLINHVALVLDASWSMRGRERDIVKVTDEQIKYLAKRSQELNQETRITVYRFGTTVECLIFDMDVARLPSANDLYEVLYENTALIDATMKSQKDLETTSQLYGDHAFLTFVLTDGAENRSSKFSRNDLTRQIMNADVNWSLGFLVPNANGVKYVEDLGVLRDSIAIWDTTSASGLNVAASSIRTATDRFMTQRAKGVRGSRSVFSTGADAVNDRSVKQNLKPVDANKYTLLHVVAKTPIAEFVRNAGISYYAGIGYYQLTKSETIQAGKQIAVVDKKTNKVYTGVEARDLIGLPSHSTRVRPNYNPKYDIYVQSTSHNRNLMPNTKLLILK
jgi:hypothetical protein